MYVRDESITPSKIFAYGAKLVQRSRINRNQGHALPERERWGAMTLDFRLGPAVGTGMSPPVCLVSFDRHNNLLMQMEATTLNNRSVERTPHGLREVQPGSVGGREMHPHERLQSGEHDILQASGVHAGVIHHKMHELI